MHMCLHYIFCVGEELESYAMRSPKEGIATPAVIEDTPGNDLCKIIPSAKKDTQMLS